tara:strand:+ start:98 stop:532 length:435 start_codon:yes stop_codon:yes gene_type:complete
MEIKYILTIYLSVIGIIEFIAHKNKLTGLQILPNKLIGFILGAALPILSLCWFFLFDVEFRPEARNLPDTNGGIDGVQQASFFILASLGGLLTNIFLSIIKNPFFGIKTKPYSFGIESLQSVNYFTALRKSAKNLWNLLIKWIT